MRGCSHPRFRGVVQRDIADPHLGKSTDIWPPPAIAGPTPGQTDGKIPELMAAALEEASLKDPDTQWQWQLLLPHLLESERQHDAPEPAPAPSGARSRPIRLSRPPMGIVIRRQMTRDGRSLHFTGKDTNSMLMDRVIEEVEDIFSPRWGFNRPEQAPR